MSSISTPVRMTGPRWMRRSPLLYGRIPEDWRSWLFNDDSLTARLKRCCGHRFRVEVVRQQYARVEYHEALALDLRPGSYALLRQVLLYCGTEALVYARSVIPLSTLTGRQRRLAYLGDRPLGEFLFSCADMVREGIEVARFETRSGQNFAEPAQEVWGRRSVFRLSGKPLLVAEIFLPAVVGLEK